MPRRMFNIIGCVHAKLCPALGDITAGLYTTVGILAALESRRRTGAGQFLDVSMMDCQVAILENAIARLQATGETPRPIGNRHPSITPHLRQRSGRRPGDRRRQ